MPCPNATALGTIHRSNGDLGDAKSPTDELTQEVVRISVRRPQALPRNAPKHDLVHCDVAALGVPRRQAGRETRQPREHVIAEPSKPGHSRSRGGPIEAVALHEVRFAAEQRPKERGCVARIHLAVRCEHDDHLGADRARRPAARRDRRTDSAVRRMPDDRHTRYGLGLPRRRVRAPIIDDDDLVDELGHAFQRAPDQRLLVVGGNHRSDRSTFDHRFGWLSAELEPVKRLRARGPRRTPV